MPAWKKRWIRYPMFSCNCFQVLNERYVFEEHSKIRLAIIYIYHIYIHHTSIRMHILNWLYDLTLFGSKVWLYNICIASMLSSCNYHSYEHHISISYRRRKGITSFIALVRIHKYHICWETWECHTMKALSFILKTYKNSGIMVEQRTWDIVLDLIVLSFNFSRSKWKLENPMIEGNMGKFESQIGLF